MIRILSVLILFIVAIGCSDKEDIQKSSAVKDDSPAVVTIDEEKYFREDILNYAFYIISEMDNSSMLSIELKDSILDDFVNHKLILREAQKDKSSLDMDKIKNVMKKFEIKNLNFFKTNHLFDEKNFEKIIYEHLAVQNYLNKQISANIKVEEPEIKDYYENNRKELKSKNLYNIYHIFNSDEKLADEAREKLYKRNSFTSVAKKYSTDAYAEAGGDMGFVDIENLPKIFQYVKSMKKGKISKVLKSEYGYHIFYLKDVDKRAVNPTIEEVSGEIYSLIYEKKQQEYINNLVKELRKNAKITVDHTFTFGDVSDNPGKGY